MTDEFQVFSYGKESFPQNARYYIPGVSLHLLSSCFIFQMSQRVQQGIQDFRIFDFCLSNTIALSSAIIFLKDVLVLFSLLLLRNVS